jgi:protein involved in polysaccharide export with SLBB domain
MIRSGLVALLLVALTAPAALHAQAARRGWDPTGLHLTRQDLQQMLAEMEATAASSSYSGTLRDRARAEAVLIRQRLEEGDIRVGDRILLVVEGQPLLTDTFNVVAGRNVVLPDLGPFSMEGVLRSELQGYMLEQISRFIRQPTVHARSLIRLEILGAVGRPGFYMIPSDMLVTDALMVAGGPAGNARTDKLRILRGREVIWDGDRLRTAVLAGRTLDQLSVRAGDGIQVPERSNRLDGVLRIGGVVTALTSLVFIADRVGAF